MQTNRNDEMQRFLINISDIVPVYMRTEKNDLKMCALINASPVNVATNLNYEKRKASSFVKEK